MVLSIALGGCDASSIPPADPHGVPRSSYLAADRQLKIGLVDYGHHTINSDYLDFIADHYDVIVSGEPDLDFAAYRAKNPSLQIYAYFNGILLSPAQAQPGAEDAYLHDGPANAGDAAQRIGRLFDSEFYYVMDPGAASWQAHSRNEINQIVSRGFDGIHIDDVYAHLMHEAHFGADAPLLVGPPSGYSEFTSVPTWYDAQASHNGFRAYLSYLNDNLGGKVLFNGINDHAERLQPIGASLHPNDYLHVSDGSIQEGFVYNGLWVTERDDGFLGSEYWEAIVQTLIDVPANKFSGVVSYGDVNFVQARTYAFASYLIGYNPDRESAYYFAPDEFSLVYLPEWNLKLGRPLLSHASVLDYRAGKFFRRDFENGAVLVNPYDEATGSIALGETFQKMVIAQGIEVQALSGRSKVAIGDVGQIAFETVASLELAPRSAAIVLR